MWERYPNQESRPSTFSDYSSPTSLEPAPTPVAPSSAVAAPRRSRLGNTALLLAVLATVIGSLFSAIAANAYNSVVKIAGTTSYTSATLPEAARASENVFGMMSLAQLVPTAVGITAIVMGIVAAAKRAEGGRGIGAILVAIAGPFVAFGVFLLVALPVSMRY